MTKLTSSFTLGFQHKRGESVQRAACSVQRVPGVFKANLVPTVFCVLIVSAPLAHAQTLDAEPRFGSLSLTSGFSPDPILSEFTPGGADSASTLPPECVGYINDSQPDFRLSFQANSNPLGILVNSSADTTLLVSDPDGTWHCNGDAFYLADTNPGVKFMQLCPVTITFGWEPMNRMRSRFTPFSPLLNSQLSSGRRLTLAWRR